MSARRWYVVLVPVVGAYVIAALVLFTMPLVGPVFGFASPQDQAALGRYVLQLILMPAAAASLVLSLRTLLTVTARSELHLGFPGGSLRWPLARPPARRGIRYVRRDSQELPFVLTNQGQAASTLYTLEIRFPEVFGAIVKADSDNHRMPQMRWNPVVGRRSDCWHPGNVNGYGVLRFYSNGVVASFQHDEMLLGTLELLGEPLPLGNHELGFTILDATGRHVKNGGLTVQIEAPEPQEGTPLNPS